MNQRTPQPKKNSQTVRLAPDLYDQVAEMALRDETTMNTAIVKLLNLGLNQMHDFEEAVKRFVFRTVSQEEIERLANVNVNKDS